MRAIPGRSRPDPIADSAGHPRDDRVATDLKANAAFLAFNSTSTSTHRAAVSKRTTWNPRMASAMPQRRKRRERASRPIAGAPSLSPARSRLDHTTS